MLPMKHFFGFPIFTNLINTKNVHGKAGGEIAAEARA
jgi:hypothetical protein